MPLRVSRRLPLLFVVRAHAVSAVSPLAHAPRPRPCRPSLHACTFTHLWCLPVHVVVLAGAPSRARLPNRLLGLVQSYARSACPMSKYSFPRWPCLHGYACSRQDAAGVLLPRADRFLRSLWRTACDALSRSLTNVPARLSLRLCRALTGQCAPANGRVHGAADIWGRRTGRSRSLEQAGQGVRAPILISLHILPVFSARCPASAYRDGAPSALRALSCVLARHRDLCTVTSALLIKSFTMPSLVVVQYQHCVVMCGRGVSWRSTDRPRRVP